jgi:hypothetical protein
MAQHNFREAVSGGGLYISKNGHDSNAGTSPNEPKKSLSTQVASVDAVNVVGAGYYTPANTGPAGSGSNQYNTKADGLVVLKLNGGTVRSRQQLIGVNVNDGIWEGDVFSSSIPFTHTDCNFNNITGFYFGSTSGGSNARRLLNCSLKNCSVFSNTVSSIYKTGIKNSVVNGGIYQFANVINSYFSFSTILQISFVSSGAVPTVADSFSVTNIVFANCNINGVIRLPISSGWKDYAIQDQLTGTPQDNGYPIGVNWLNETNLTADGFIGTVAGWNAVVATMINRDPQFIDAAGDNYNLMANSPHIGTGFGGANIGGTVVGEQTTVQDDGVGTVSIIKSAEIDDSVPGALILDTGQTEGFVRIIKFVPRTIKKLLIDAQYLFDSDAAGGAPTNNNVPDSEPLSTDYAKLTVTVASGSTTQFILDNAETIVIGDWCRVDGEAREVTNVEANTPSAGQKRVTVASAFRATVGSAVEVTYGTEAQIAVLTPNRLTIQMRVSKNAITNPPDPNLDSDWDNDVDPGYGVVGDYFNQEIEQLPGLYIIAGVVYGAGDSNRPAGGTLQEIGNCWVDCKVWLRNNFSHKGL